MGSLIIRESIIVQTNKNETLHEPMIEETIQNQFPELNEPGLVRELSTYATLKEFKAGEHLIDMGNYIKFMPLVVDGAIKVMREDEDGREVFLYFLYPGQTCAMTMSCCSVNKPSEITAVAEYDTILIAIPVEVMDTWFRKYRNWQNFVLNTYNNRFNELLNTLDGIAFRQLDERLLHYLRHKADLQGNEIIETTHQQIAYDLNSSREVISRLLKQLEKKGMIELGRNKITLL